MQAVRRRRGADSVAAPLTVSRLVEVSRELLVEGGPAAIQIREVARRLSVSAPALYKHVTGRADLLTLLIAACTGEATRVCLSARSSCDPTNPVAQLEATTWAFRSWAHQNRAEFGLVYGTPISGYVAPDDGPTATAAQDFGQVFAGIFVALSRAGLLVIPASGSLSASLTADLDAYADRAQIPMSAEELYPFVVGWQRMLGTISVEISGHLDWLLNDTEAFVRGQLDVLLRDLVKPGSPGLPDHQDVTPGY